MCQHETKTCQRCNTPFECKPGSITQCQCFGVMLTAEERAFLEQRYTDCLCRNCLMAIKEEFELSEKAPLPEKGDYKNIRGGLKS